MTINEMPAEGGQPIVLERIVSGGQTGADRGGLDTAIALGLAHGGWCPHGRRAEDGGVPVQYHLKETESATYQVRTRCNVRDSDGTVVFTRGAPIGGTRLTVDYARELRRPLLVLELRDLEHDAVGAAAAWRAWLMRYRIRTMNVAGPRESKVPGIQAAVRTFLVRALAAATTVAVSLRDDADITLPAVAEAHENYAATRRLPQPAPRRQPSRLS